MGLSYRLVPDPQVNFEKALAACSFVLSTAGHQIIAESIALNKPILVIPQRGQWEQQLNAEMVEETGKGRSTTVETAVRDLEHFQAQAGPISIQPRAGALHHHRRSEVDTQKNRGLPGSTKEEKDPPCFRTLAEKSVSCNARSHGLHPWTASWRGHPT